MASPQLEDGYTKIANEIIDALCKFRMPGECRQVLDCVFRKTYGYHKKEDWIANSQIVEMTGMKKGNASRALSKLITNKIVIKTDNKLRLNKNYKDWVSFKSLSKVITGKKNKVVIQIATAVIQSDNKLLSKVRDTKDNKDNITKDITYVETDVSLNHLINLFKGVNPNYNLFFSNKTERGALQRQVDKFSYKKIENLLNQLPEIVTRPYAPRIPKPSELEKKMGQLIIFLNQDKNNRRKVVVAKGI